MDQSATPSPPRRSRPACAQRVEHRLVRFVIGHRGCRIAAPSATSATSAAATTATTASSAPGTASGSVRRCSRRRHTHCCRIRRRQHVLRYADADLRQRHRRIEIEWHAARRRISWIVAVNRRKDEREILGAPGDRPWLVHRPRQRHSAVPRHASVRRPQTAHSAYRRRRND